MKRDSDFKAILAFLLGFLLLSALLTWTVSSVKGSLLLTQAWTWNEVPGATSYRIYWSATTYIWCSRNGLTVPASACVSGICKGDISLPSYSVFIVVTALKGAAESSTGHGDVVACP